MDCCENIELQSNTTKDSGFALGIYKRVNNSNADATGYPVYQSRKGSDTLVYTPRGKFWRVSCQFYANECFAFHTMQVTHHRTM